MSDRSRTRELVARAPESFGGRAEANVVDRMKVVGDVTHSSGGSDWSVVIALEGRFL